MPPESYTLVLRYNQSHYSTLPTGGPWEVRVPARVPRDRTDSVTANLANTGVMRGAVTINGTAPGEGSFTLCLTAARRMSGAYRIGDYDFCMAVPASGDFSVLLPEGPGEGVICANELTTGGGCPRAAPRYDLSGSAPLWRGFSYDVREATTTDVTSLIGN